MFLEFVGGSVTALLLYRCQPTQVRTVENSKSCVISELLSSGADLPYRTDEFRIMLNNAEVRELIRGLLDQILKPVYIRFEGK